MQRDLEGISQKVLTDSLRQMIDDGLVYRHDYHEWPLRGRVRIDRAWSTDASDSRRTCGFLELL